jgi:hypothetical protein
MATIGAAHRKGAPVARAAKSDAPPDASEGTTIRVSRCLAPVQPRPVAPAPEQNHQLPNAPGLPCSGRCGHCHNHPCLLHAAI